MPVEHYDDRVTSFRKNNPDCNYCISNKYYGVIGRVAECEARQMCCWDSKKTAKKCELYSPKFFSLWELKL